MKILQIGILLLIASGIAGCGPKPTQTATSALSTNPPISGSTNVNFFLVRGTIKKIIPDEKKISIQHEEIPNYMPAMTMPFNVKELSQLDGLAPGDAIWFRLWVSADESWIDKITKAVAAPPQTNAPPEREAVRVARDVEPLQVGDLMTNYTFTNELGRTVQLQDFRGQALAFTFIFTRCPLPDFCPRMSRNFADVCEKLKAMSNGPTNWHLLSISFDPHFDTPSVLEGYSKAFQNDPLRWNFVTGAMIDIDAITDQFELIIVKRGNDWDHKMRTVVIDTNGRVQKIIYGNEWKPDELVEEIVKAAQVKLTASTPARVP